jgi:plastocyanin
MKKLIGSKSRLLLDIAILFAIFNISNSCTKTTTYDGSGGVTEGPSIINEVSVSRGGFYPPVMTVAAGTIITWTSTDGPQSVTSDSGLFEGIITSGENYSYRFSTIGTYLYHNRINPNVTGKVVVN